MHYMIKVLMILSYLLTISKVCVPKTGVNPCFGVDPRQAPCGFFDAPLDLVARSGLPDSSTRHQPGSPCSMFSTKARVFTRVRAVRAGTIAPTLPWLSNLHWLFDMAGVCRATPCELHRDR